MSPRAIAKIGDTVVAETDTWEVVEGNIYFPKKAIKDPLFHPTDTHTFCPWKGTANYFTIDIEGKLVKDAAWSYPETLEKADFIRDYVAFYKGKVDVETV